MVYTSSIEGVQYSLDELVGLEHIEDQEANHPEDTWPACTFIRSICVAAAVILVQDTK